jgi:hypothetical protein
LREGWKGRDILLPVMNLVLILVVSMMPRSIPEVRQLHTLPAPLEPLFPAYKPITVAIIQREHLPHAFVFAGGGHGARGLVVEAVKGVNVGGIPEARGVEVMQREEGAWVEV